MDDKTPIYMILIVALVAVVGLIIVLSQGPSASYTTSTADSGNALTGNVAYDTSSPTLNTFGKLFFTAFLVGIAGYMYFRRDE